MVYEDIVSDSTLYNFIRKVDKIEATQIGKNRPKIV